MSYILEALKKADAERKLGTVPGIHAQPLADVLPAGRSSPWSKPWRWMVAAACAAGMLGLAWFKPWQTLSVPEPQAAPKPALTKLAPPAPALAPAPALPAPVAHPPATAPSPSLAKAKPAAKKPAKPAAKARHVPHAPARVARATAETVFAPKESLPTFHDLPAHIQREIPRFTVGGYLYSDRLADRSVLIDKRLLRDGDQIAPDLRLEKMMPNGMVLDYKGYRYRTSY